MFDYDLVIGRMQSFIKYVVVIVVYMILYRNTYCLFVDGELFKSFRSL